MKSADFFIDKAQTYLTEIDEIIPNYIDWVSEGFNDSPRYKAQSAKIDELMFKVKLLFSEFDNGKTFNARIDEVDSNMRRMTHGLEHLKECKHVLNLFIEHLNEFRKG